MKVRDVIKKIENAASYSETGRSAEMSDRDSREYVVVLEKDESNRDAYAPNLPGLGIVADTPEEAERLSREGIEIDIDELRERGETIPEPVSLTRRIAVAA